MPVTATRKLSRLHKPPDMSLEAWQRELRRQFGREQAFTLTNAGTESVFSDFHVSNPRSGSTHRVAICGPRPGDNYCSCPDFATNALVVHGVVISLSCAIALPARSSRL